MGALVRIKDLLQRRRLWALVLIVAISACASHQQLRITPDEHVLERLRVADALVRAGCFDCLDAAYREYDALRTTSQGRETATVGALRAATLLGIRERELGTDDTGYLTRARDILRSSNESVRADASMLLDIADALPSRGTRQLADDVDLNRRQAAYRNRDAYIERLRAHADEDPLSAYLWITFNCAYGTPGEEVTDWLDKLQAWGDTPLIAFKAATCRGYDRAALDRLTRTDERFVETHYFLGLGAVLEGKFDEAVDHFQRAYSWRPRWPAVTNSLADAHIALEEFNQASSCSIGRLPSYRVPQMPSSVRRGRSSTLDATPTRSLPLMNCWPWNDGMPGTPAICARSTKYNLGKTMRPGMMWSWRPSSS